ncbi:MAG: hypothetical protein Q7J25_05740 [Vicinamibacterales bacterium]|nr:hypothetical protein [Vicinamibacterales bacterium]
MKTMSWLRSTALMAIALGAVASGACAAKSINQILVDPSRYVKGRIRDGFNFGSLGEQVKLPAGLGSGLVLGRSINGAVKDGIFSRHSPPLFSASGALWCKMV